MQTPYFVQFFVSIHEYELLYLFKSLQCVLFFLKDMSIDYYSIRDKTELTSTVKTNQEQENSL